MSISWPSAVTPAILVRPEAAASLDEAHAAIELWEHYSRKTLDEGQRLTVEVLMAQDAAGRWAAPTTGRAMSRQNGKGDEIEVVEVWGLVQRSEAILHTVHDAVLLASQAQQRMLSVLEGHADLRRLVKRKWLGTGQQMIELHNGGTIWYRTRTGGGGRGVDDIDRLVVDEAQHAQDDQMAALTPTMLANENAQLNALGSAGIEGKSAWWWRMRRRALSPNPGAFGWVEHTAEKVRIDPNGAVVSEPVDVDDRALWLEANPAIQAGRGQGMAFLEEQRRRLDPRSFAREHMGVWDPEPQEHGEEVIPHVAWQHCADSTASRGDRVAYAIDAAPDGASASIAASDGLVSKVLEHGPGTSWVAAAMASLTADRPGPVFLDPRSPAGALLVDLHDAGVDTEDVSPQQHAQACGGLLAAVTFDGPDRRFLHTDQPHLNAAVSGATRRVYGDAWAWSRRSSKVDISPLVAVTLARWGALTLNDGGRPLVMILGGS